MGSRGSDNDRRVSLQTHKTLPNASDDTTAATPTCFTVPSNSIASPLEKQQGDYFIVASRLLPYKRIDLAICAASLAGVKLLIAGTGPAERSLREQAKGTTTTLLGYVPDARLNELMGNARAAIVPGEEDFGLVPLEAAAAGRPTIAYRGGGALETIVEGETGAFFDEPTAESLAATLRNFDAGAFRCASLAGTCRKIRAGKLHRSSSRHRRARLSRENGARRRTRRLMRRMALPSQHGSLWATCIAAAAFSAVYITLDLNKLYALRYGADLGTYLQTLVNLQHGSSWNYGEWKYHFQVHDSWILTLLVPLVALFPYAQTLIVVQVLAVACAAIPLVLLAGELGLTATAANLLGIAYLLSPAAQGLSYDNFAENVFVPVLALVRRSRGAQAIVVVDAALRATPDGTQGRSDSVRALVRGGVCPLVGPAHRSGAGRVGVVNGAGFWSFERTLGVHPNDPAYSLEIFNPASKLSMLFLLLAPFAFAPLAIGRWLLLGLPLAVEIIFMRPWNYEPSRIGSHYVAPLFAATATAAAFGVTRYGRFARYLVPSALVVMLLFNDTVLRPGRWPFIVDWNAYARAVALRRSSQTALLSRRDEGVWAVAAANPGRPARSACRSAISAMPRIRHERGGIFRKPRRTRAVSPMRRRSRASLMELTRLVVPAIREDRGRFAALRNARVLIYWPHGLGDWVHFGGVAPLLDVVQHRTQSRVSATTT